MTSPVLLFSHQRTVFGKYAGALAGTRPDDAAAVCVAAAAAAAGQATIDEVILGNANGAGEENRNVARMSALLAGLDVTTPGVTVNRLCGSGMQAAIDAARMISLDEADVVVAGGVESMTRSPWVVQKPERPFAPHDAHMISTALGWRLINPAMPQEHTASLGAATEALGSRHGITRDQMDAFAARSHERAARAWRDGLLAPAICPVPGVQATRDDSVRDDCDMERLSALKPVFSADGSITAGNASPLSDGAATLLLGSERADLGEPLARIVSWGRSACAPADFGIAPVEAAERALHRAGLTYSDLDVIELNEAFAAQALACMKQWPVDAAIVNDWGGAIAIGHPLGASGARIVGVCADRLRNSGSRFGLAALCIGVGQGLAVVLENVARHA